MSSYVSLFFFGLVSAASSSTSGVLWQGLHAYELKPHTAYAVEHTVEVGLVYYLPHYDRLSAFCLHGHIRKGASKPLGEFSLYHYFVEHSDAPTNP